MAQVESGTLSTALVVVLCFSGYSLMMVAFEPESTLAGAGAVIIVGAALLVGRYVENYIGGERQAS